MRMPSFRQQISKFTCELVKSGMEGRVEGGSRIMYNLCALVVECLSLGALNFYVEVLGQKTKGKRILYLCIALLGAIE